MTTFDSAADWWRDAASDRGLQLMDQHVAADADWDTAAKTGAQDFDRALQLTGMPTGPQCTALEIGCGAGRMTGALAQRFGQVVAVDVSEAFIQLARQQCRSRNVTWRVSSGRDLQAVTAGQFDVAFSYEVFHYLETTVLERYIQDVYQALKTQGVFVLQLNTEPLRWLTRASLLVRYGLHGCGKKYWRGWPTSPHFIRHTYSAECLAETLRRHGFRVEKLLQPGTRQTWFVAVK